MLQLFVIPRKDIECGRALGANDEADCEAECEKLWNAGGLAKNE